MLLEKQLQGEDEVGIWEKVTTSDTIINLSLPSPSSVSGRQAKCTELQSFGDGLPVEDAFYGDFILFRRRGRHDEEEVLYPA